MVDVYTGNGTMKGNATAVAHVSAVMPHPGVVVGAVVAVLLTAVIITVVVVLLVILGRRMRKSSDSFKPLKREKKRDAAKEEEVEMASLEGDESIRDFSVPIPKSTFSEHVAALHAGEDKGFEAEYDTITNDPNGLDDIAKTHRHKNRYLNIYTYNHSRVALSICDDKGSDYINASYIDGYKAASMYIASQGATQSTRADFIQMILDHKAPVVVMLTKLVENGKPKCERYWNDEVDTPLELSDYLTVTTTACRSYSGYEMRTLSITNTRDAADTPHVVKHFYYTAWPDHGVPECPSSIVKFIQHVRRHYGSSYAPLVVHCSAGVGRTGTFITIDAMMQRLKAKDDLNIYEYVSYMRTRRTFMVQNQDQYSFIHDALVDYIRCGETVFAPHELRLAITELEAVDSDAKDSGFQRQFKVLEESSKSPSSDDEDTFKKPGMVKKNRYKNKHPYSSGYPHLPGKTGGAGADYYNASFIDGFQGKRAFIAAQSPLPNTRNDFWEVVWFFKTPTIVLLCNFKEGDQESCSKFWPDKQLHSMEFGSLSVTFKDAHELDGYDMVTLEVKDTKRETRPSHPVTLFHYKEWSLGDKPQIDSLLAMMGQVEKCQAGKGKPPTIMCDDGMGRTGVFIGTMSEIERVKLEGEVDIFNTIKCLRNNRPHMVCTVNQYELCFELLQAYLDSFDTYANFKVV
jgi:netrin-G3 ligand